MEYHPLPNIQVNDPRLLCYFQIIHLKRQLRRGWLRSGVSPEQCESVADHSFGTAMLCLLHADNEIEPAQAALMALVHDLGEIHAGDITPYDGVTKAEKHARELASLELVLANLEPILAHRLRMLWDEYEAQASPTAQFVKAMDRLEMACQARVYQAEGKTGMEEFLESARSGLAGSKWTDFFT